MARFSSALPWCTVVHGPGGTGDNIDKVMSAVYGHFRIGHLVGGNREFDGWPRWDSHTHQAVYEDWLERAWQGGLRLMVMMAVNNETMCGLVNRAAGRTCKDMEAVDLQIQAAKDMEAYIDNKRGGPGKGWYRIVKTPEEAQAVIDAGNLAVILGIEVDYLFGSYPTSNLSESQVRTEVDKYYKMGVRHVFLIHFADNAFGGCSFDKDILQYDPNLGGWSWDPLSSGAYVEISGIRVYLNKVITQDASGPPYNYRFKGGRMNVQGLTNLGRFVTRELMAKGMIIDVDHMSYKSRSAVLDIAESKNCPVVSGHTGFVEISMGDKRHEGNLLPAEVERIRALGGMVSVIPHQGKFNEIGTWGLVGGTGGTVVKHTCGNSSETLVQAYLYAVSKMKGTPVGLGTDFNGFAGLPGPRFGKEACPGKVPTGTPGWVDTGDTTDHLNQVTYPFVAVASGVQLPNSKVGNKVFNFNVDGLAHVGMLPDLIADFQALGLTDRDLEPLLNSAQGYIDVWRKVWTNGPSPYWTSLEGVLTSDPAISRTKAGTLDVFVRGTDGLVWHRRQMVIGSTDQWTPWTPIPGVTVTGNISIGLGLGGRMELFVRGADNKLYNNTESTAGSNQWTGWVSRGGTTTVTSDPVIGSNADSRLVVFARGTDGGLASLVHFRFGGWKWGTAPPGGLPGGGIVGKPAVVSTWDGRMVVFVRGNDNKLYCTQQGEVDVDNDWSQWFVIDATGTLASEPAVAEEHG